MSATANRDVIERLAMSSHRLDSVCVLCVGGELDLFTAPTLCAAIEERFDEPLLLDLSELQFCDSTGLRAVYGVAQEARAHRARLLILPPQRDGAARAFAIAGAAEFLPLTADAHEAITQLKGDCPRQPG